MHGTWCWKSLGAATVIAIVAGITWAQKPEKAADRFKAAGKDAALTVLPTRLAGRPSAQVGEVVALLLERGGMSNLETSQAEFTPPEGTDLAKTATAFAEFIRTNPPATEYALFTEFLGSPAKGVTEVRAVAVTKKGEIAWQDRQAKGDADFDRVKPDEPMECCLLVVQRLRPVLGLGDPTSATAPQGKIAQRWQKETGVPDQAELAAIEKRGRAFKKAAAKATLIVYPAHAGDAYSSESAAAISVLINDKKLTQATAADKGPRLAIGKSINEQKVLWSMARGFSEYVKKNPPRADYVLFADYIMVNDKIAGVHFAICDKQGDLVAVDFQNGHQADFQAVNPRTREDCDKLVVRRVEGLCK